MSKNVGIIFAGGTGQRMGLKDIPKQFVMIEKKPIIIHTLELFENHEEIDEIYISCIESWIGHLNKLIEKYKITKVKSVVSGGKTGQESIYNALIEARKYCADDDVVLIHDGVRPLITSNLISEVIKSTKENGNGITSTACFETIVINNNNKKVGYVPFRKDTYSVQAPQAFLLKDIIDVHDEIRKDNPTYENMIDSCTMCKVLGKELYMVQGNRGNIKVTTPEDVFVLEGLFKFKKSEGMIEVPNFIPNELQAIYGENGDVESKFIKIGEEIKKGIKKVIGNESKKESET